MKGLGFLFGLSFSTVLKVVCKFFKSVVTFIAEVLYYFGLYVPLAYLIYGGILYGVFQFDPFSLSTDSKLYLFGLGLCFVASIIITVKTLIVKPLKSLFSKPRTINDEAENESDGGEKRRKSFKRRGGDFEAPYIYESEVNPGVIVYEYANRFDLYEPDGKGALIPVGTEFKDTKRRAR